MQKSWGFLLLTLSMPFIASFHVSMGAPWMFTTVLVEVLCLSSYVIFNKDNEVTKEVESVLEGKEDGGI